MENAKFGLDISDYLKQENKVSALALSNFLIESKGYSKVYFSTGRPKIYVNVVNYLEKLERQGLIKSLNKDVSDCTYELLSEQFEVVDAKKEISKNYNSDLKIESQLSLF
ncbi:DUF3895 domain-containing protein [Metabacillus halosaccharovorans]|uniref:DUF3895 domain-containing protein n=1 Tax=Metabacillus halosaccharovorans TaxID=930124 RepID=UPI001C1F979C|nr:DUF3895 domain-containing protein [Metabacillus halosaccharovorans]MBU7595939.1 DUF3895 domain-containing protein [Metabacillus halosaccharovorans]